MLSFDIIAAVWHTVQSLVLCAEYSKSLMREAKAHFEGAAAVAIRAESAPATSSSNSSQPSGTASSASQPQTAESGRLHLTSRDSSSSSSSASQRADAKDSNAGGDAKRNPQTALAAAHKATKQPGSSTALVLQLKEGSSTLKASNLVCFQADTSCCSCT